MSLADLVPGTLESPDGWYAKPGGNGYGQSIQGLGSYAGDLASFRALNGQARSMAQQGRQAEAVVFLGQAEAVSAANPAVDPGGAEVAYTRQIMAGDEAARADQAAGQRLVVAGRANSVPGSVWGAAAEGFGEGLRQGGRDLAEGRWFFGTDPVAKAKQVLRDAKDSVTDLATPYPYLLTGGALLLGYGAAKKAGIL